MNPVKLKTIAVVGNPNSGKTTLFNELTGSNQRIGNWPGVTVEKLEGEMLLAGETVRVVDIPGIYSISTQSEDERIARDFILSGEADLFVNIVDATNLTRNLLLTAQLLEMNVPVLLAVNMMDLAKKQDIELDIDHLGKSLGVRAVGISAVDRKGLPGFEAELVNALQGPLPEPATVKYPNEVEEIILDFQARLEAYARSSGASPRWLAIKLVENDRHVDDLVYSAKIMTTEEVEKGRLRISGTLGEDTDKIISDFRWGYVQAVVTHVIKRKSDRRNFSDQVDRFALSPWLGIPLFFLVMYVVFWATTTLGGAFIDFFGRFSGTIFVEGSAALLRSVNAPEWVVAMLSGGVGTGIQTVATFIPIIFMMFFMLAVLEDSGYMARAAFIMDRFMRFLGLPGKAFVPLIVGFGCTVPAILATRTLEHRRDRLLTIFIAPLMSCGARLPVYALFASVFFRGQEGNIVFSLYIAGIILAVLSGLLLRNTLFSGEASHFIMELPSYHAPRLRHIFLHTAFRLKIFIGKAGVLIIIAVTLLGILNSIGTDGNVGNNKPGTSLLAFAGKAITPVFQPMGIREDNWPASVALISGIFAKESVVGTIASLYRQEEQAENPAGRASSGAGNSSSDETGGFDFWAGILDSLRTIPDNLAGIFMPMTSEKDETIDMVIKAHFSGSGAQAYAYLLFILIYFPCVGAMSAIFREAGKAIGLLVIAYLTILGWITAVIFYQIAEGGQILWILVALGLLGLVSVMFFLLRRSVEGDWLIH